MPLNILLCLIQNPTTHVNGIKWGLEVKKFPKFTFLRDNEYQRFSFWYIIDLKNNYTVSIDYFVFLETLEIKICLLCLWCAITFGVYFLCSLNTHWPVQYVQSLKRKKWEYSVEYHRSVQLQKRINIYFYTCKFLYLTWRSKSLPQILLQLNNFPKRLNIVSVI